MLQLFSLFLWFCKTRKESSKTNFMVKRKILPSKSRHFILRSCCVSIRTNVVLRSTVVGSSLDNLC